MSFVLNFTDGSQNRAPRCKKSICKHNAKNHASYASLLGPQWVPYSCCFFIWERSCSAFLHRCSRSMVLACVEMSMVHGSVFPLICSSWLLKSPCNPPTLSNGETASWWTAALAFGIPPLLHYHTQDMVAPIRPLTSAFVLLAEF